MVQDNNIGVTTGNWGCDTSKRDLEVNTMIQWLATSQESSLIFHVIFAVSSIRDEIFAMDFVLDSLSRVVYFEDHEDVVRLKLELASAFNNHSGGRIIAIKEKRYGVAVFLRGKADVGLIDNVLREKKENLKENSQGEPRENQENPDRLSSSIQVKRVGNLTLGVDLYVGCQSWLCSANSLKAPCFWNSLALGRRT
ncbi:hypothetical protein Fmac_002010 [Flemingia macrophylla]|uniref:PARG catalytic Macro domain-containing protein n=1 Tax=Flemingia macrophylla TaxID=520843 RepID=A0ABD1NIQ6_9FABA